MICVEHDSVGGTESGNRWPVVAAILVVAGMQWRHRIQVGLHEQNKSLCKT